MTAKKTPPLKGEWTTIELNGRKYTVLCQPAPEPADTELNDVQVYLKVMEFLKYTLFESTTESKHSDRAIQNWLDKFPKPINSK